MNNVPLKRIADQAEISMDTVYRKMDFIHRQCNLFVGHRERALVQQPLGKRYIATDRQMYLVNWNSRKDRRNIQLLAIASADVETGYVFAMNLNFDGEMDAATVEADLERVGDVGLPLAFRRYARVWLRADYEAAAARSHSRARVERPSEMQIASGTALEAMIRKTYVEAASRIDVESSANPNPDQQLPLVGMQVHEQCSMNAHLRFVAALLRTADKVRFFMDHESGIRAAFMSAFADRVQNRTADAWYVRPLKEATIDAKKKMAREAKACFVAVRVAKLDVSDWEIYMLLMKEEMYRVREIGRFKDRWVKLPLSNGSEPAREVCWLTDLGDYTEDHAARLYLKATLHPVDRFFMKVRRRLKMADRAVPSSANGGRVWYGYNAVRSGKSRAPLRDLPGPLQLLPSGRGQENAGDEAWTGQGSSGPSRHHLLFAALNAREGKGPADTASFS